MRKYNGLETSIIQPTAIKEEFVFRSRKQALDIFKARFLIALLVTFSIVAIIFSFSVDIASKSAVVALLLSVAYGVTEYSKALEKFTNEDRDILWEMHCGSKTELVIPESETIAHDDITVIPQPKGNGHYNLHVGLTETQLQYIAKTMLDTKTLTINYIESLGISRANAERLRIELSEHKLLEFDSKGRVTLTHDGEKVCKRIVK